MLIEEKFMWRCLELARCGAGHTEPNPMVGAVVVHNGKIIGEGYHRKCGEGHAEVNAIASVRDESLLRDATLYVSLEPCSHYGKTPPCAELILRKRIPRVVVGCMDPFPEVSGRGVKMLREGGVEVVAGVLEREAWELNRVFMTVQTLRRPYIRLKWAQSRDGFIDKARTSAAEPPVVFSTPETQVRVHKMRAESAAIMVGTRTALLDNPSLTVRRWAGQSPVRVVLDREFLIPNDYHLLDGSQPTLVFTLEGKGQEGKEIPGVTYCELDRKVAVLPQILDELFRRKLNSLMVEGGAMLLNSFLEAGLWDEATVETAPVELGAGVEAPIIRQPAAETLFCAGHRIDIYRRRHSVGDNKISKSL